MNWLIRSHLIKVIHSIGFTNKLDEVFQQLKYGSSFQIDFNYYLSIIQRILGTLLYFGSNGLTRNIPLAVEYFHLAAHQQDIGALFMYGMVLIKVYYPWL